MARLAVLVGANEALAPLGRALPILVTGRAEHDRLVNSAHLASARAVTSRLVVCDAQGAPFHRRVVAPHHRAGYAGRAHWAHAAIQRHTMLEADARAPVLRAQRDAADVDPESVALALVDDAIQQCIALEAEPLLVEAPCADAAVLALVVVDATHHVRRLDVAGCHATDVQRAHVLVALGVHAPRLDALLAAGATRPGLGDFCRRSLILLVHGRHDEDCEEVWCGEV